MGTGSRCTLLGIVIGISDGNGNDMDEMGHLIDDMIKHSRKEIWGVVRKLAMTSCKCLAKR